MTGPSGSGKSTLILTLFGLISPLGGKVLVNDVILSAMAWNNTYQKIGFIPQEPFLFHMSIRDNVTYPLRFTNPAERLLEVQDALTKANLNPDRCLEGIEGLSGGERQRLMFARAFFHSPSLLVIDEGTSAMDMENEKLILKNVKEHFAHCIVVNISHRDSIKEYGTQFLHLEKLSESRLE